MINSNTKIIVLLVITTIISVSYTYLDLWLPYFNEFVIGHKYQYANKTHPFVVAIEPEHEDAPTIVKQILIQAFPEYNLVFDNSYPDPNLIIRSQTIIRKERNASIYKNLDIPYITISGEPNGMPMRKLRAKGLPFANIVVYDSTAKHNIYLPFFLWSGVELQTPISYNNYDTRKFLVYVSENCVPQREKFFKLAKAKNSASEALGACSNTVGGELIPGGYGDLNETYSQYNFVIAMENTQKPGYITEKIINAFNSGAIPIYWGDSATVKTIFNPKAFIDLNDFENFEQAIAFIDDLHQNPSKLAQMRQENIFNANYNILSTVNDPNSEYIAQQAKKIRSLYDEIVI